MKKDFTYFSRRKLESIFRPENVIDFSYKDKDSLKKSIELLKEKVKSGEIIYSRAIRRLNMILTSLTNHNKGSRDLYDELLILYKEFKKECYNYAT